MKATATTMSQPLHVPSAKTIAISLLQVLGFAAMLYAIAQICLFLSGTAEGYGKDLQSVLRWAWVVPVPFYALAIGAKLAAEITGSPSLLRSPWISCPALIVFSLPTLVFAGYAIQGLSASIETQDTGIIISSALSLVMFVICVAATYYLYYIKHTALRGKPVMNVFVLSLLPIIPLVLATIGSTLILIFVSIIVLKFLLPLVKRAV